jgi:hypothetical protein
MSTAEYLSTWRQIETLDSLGPSHVQVPRSLARAAIAGALYFETLARDIPGKGGIRKSDLPDSSDVQRIVAAH